MAEAESLDIFDPQTRKPALQAIADELREAMLLLEPENCQENKDSDFRCVFVNAPFLSKLRCPEDRVIGKTLGEIRTKNEFAWMDRCERAIQADRRDSFSIYDTHINKWLDICIFPIPDSKFVLLVNDVTRERDFHAESDAEFTVLRTLTKMTKMTEDFLFTLDPSGRFTGVFGKWLEANGFTSDFFVGKEVAEVLGEDAGVNFESALMQAVMNGYTEYCWSFHKNDGREPAVLQVLITPIEQTGKNYGMLGIGRDITKLIHKQNELNRALQEKTVLLQEVLHRVNNNLQLIISLVELQLMDDSNLDADAQMGVLKSRICAMATVHEALAMGPLNDKIRLFDLMEKLAGLFEDEKKLFSSIVVDTIQVDENIILPVEVALPVALILHEYALRIAGGYSSEGAFANVAFNGTVADGNRCELRVLHPSAGNQDTYGNLSDTLIQGLASQIKGTVRDLRLPVPQWQLFFPLAGAGHPQLPTYVEDSSQKLE